MEDDAPPVRAGATAVAASPKRSTRLASLQHDSSVDPSASTDAAIAVALAEDEYQGMDDDDDAPLDDDDSENELEAALLAPTGHRNTATPPHRHPAKRASTETASKQHTKRAPAPAPAPAAAAAVSASAHAAPAAAAAAAAASSAPTPSRLTLSSLTPHLILFPSHKHDPVYTDGCVAVEERKTSFECSAIDDLEAMLHCPVVMNTPEFVVNHPRDIETTIAIEHKENEKGMEGAGRGMTRSSRSATAPLLGGAAAAAAAYPSAPPAFLLSSSLLPFEDDDLAASFRHSSSSDYQEGPARSGFVQCVKCQKWRTVSPDVETRDLPRPWSCDMNWWNRSFARCSASDELFEAGDLWPGMPCKFVRLVKHYAFYTSLISFLDDLIRSNAAAAAANAHAHSAAAMLGLRKSELVQWERFPLLRKKPVDLYVAYHSVIQLGGFDKVSASNQWRTIQSCLHIPDSADATQSLRRIYRKWLLDYETSMWMKPKLAAQAAANARKGGQGPETVGAGAEAAAHRKRRQRQMRESSGGRDSPDADGAPKRSRRISLQHAQQQHLPPLPASSVDQPDRLDHADLYGDGTDLLDELAEHAAGEEEAKLRLHAASYSSGSRCAAAAGASSSDSSSLVASLMRELRVEFDIRFSTLRNEILQHVDDRFQQLKASQQQLRSDLASLRSQSGSFFRTVCKDVIQVHVEQRLIETALNHALNPGSSSSSHAAASTPVTPSTAMAAADLSAVSLMAAAAAASSAAAATAAAAASHSLPSQRSHATVTSEMPPSAAAASSSAAPASAASSIEEEPELKSEPALPPVAATASLTASAASLSSNKHDHQSMHSAPLATAPESRTVTAMEESDSSISDEDL